MAIDIRDFTLEGLPEAKRKWIVQNIPFGNPNVRQNASPSPDSSITFIPGSTVQCGCSVTNDYVADESATNKPVHWSEASFAFAQGELTGKVASANGTLIDVLFERTQTGIKCTVAPTSPGGVWTGTHP